MAKEYAEAEAKLKFKGSSNYGNKGTSRSNHWEA